MIYLGRNPIGVSDTVSVVPIDDTAGIGDTTKVWSADKSATEVNNLKSAFAEHEQYAEDTYAKQDGYYQDMAVGTAEQLVSSKFVEDQEPYTIRASGGSADIGNRENLTAIVGGTLAWNQQVRDGASDNVTGFADIVTVDDAVADNAGAKVKIEPVQDLHGYDSPWPGGGGKNLWPYESMTTPAYNTRLNESVYPEVFAMARRLTPGAKYRTGSDTSNGGRSFSALNIYYSDGTSALIRQSSMSGAIADLSDGSITIETINVQLGTSDGTGERTSYKMVLEQTTTSNPAYTPYSNICPISGWTGANVWDDPKYGGLIKWNQIAQLTEQTWHGGWQNTSFTVDQNEIVISAVVTKNDVKSRTALLPLNHVIVAQFSAKYTGQTSEVSFIGFARQSNAKIKGITPTQTYTDYAIMSMSGDAYTTVCWFALRMRNEAQPDTDEKLYVKNLQIFDLTEMFGEAKANEILALENATAGAGVAWFKSLFPADYYPYNTGETTTVSAVNGDPYRHYSITLPSEAGTVYGGSLTVNEDGTGTLVVDRAVVDLGTLGFSYDSTGKRWQILMPDIVNYASRNANILAEKYATDVTAKAGDIGKMFTVGKGLYIYDIDSQNAPSGSFVYPLSAPQIFTLSASQVQTILGTNNVWADAGQLSLTYKGTDEHLTLTDGRKYLTRINGVDSMVLGAGQALTAVKGRDNVFDLTQMFGTAAVADYVYGQGAGYFRKWFPNSVYAYNPGELKSVEGLQSHDTVGFNLWDEEWESGAYDSSTGEKTVNESWWRSKSAIRVIPEMVYCAKAQMDIMSICFYDAAMNFILQRTIYTRSAYATFTVPSDAYYLTFCIWKTAPKEVCINLSNSGSRNGEYEPYEKHSYPLDSSVILRGIPKVGANGVHWDGDRYLPDGTVERRYGVVDMGTLSWSYGDNSGRWGHKVFYVDVSDRKIASVYMCGKHTYTNTSISLETFPDKSCGASSNSYAYIRDDSFTDAAAFKAAMSGVLLVYELATPTTETAQPYHSTQWVSDWGTEEFVATGLVPVGHVTQYPANLRDKLQHLPDLASSNGIYIVKQTDSEMELMRLPDMPTANGNYRLKLNVASGSPTFSWEVVT